MGSAYKTYQLPCRFRASWLLASQLTLVMQELREFKGNVLFSGRVGLFVFDAPALIGATGILDMLLECDGIIIEHVELDEGIGLVVGSLEIITPIALNAFLERIPHVDSVAWNEGPFAGDEVDAVVTVGTSFADISVFDELVLDRRRRLSD